MDAMSYLPSLNGPKWNSWFKGNDTILGLGPLCHVRRFKI